MASSKDFRVAGKDLVDYICDYLDTIEERPPLAQVQPGYLRDLIPNEAPEKPETWEDVKKDIERVIMPGVTHWHSPHFHAYYPCGNSFPSLLGDMLADAIGCVGFSWIASPACTELETAMLNWLGKMVQLPETFLAGEHSVGGGVIQGTASEATLMALLTAKMKMIRKQQRLNPGMDQFDILPKLVAYTSAQSHWTVERAALVSSVRIRLLPTDAKFALRADTLINAMEEDMRQGLIPTYVCVTLGTTNSAAFDHLLEIGPACEDRDVWLHIDAAYAGSAFICPEYRYLLNGVEFANSFNFNPHKWLRVHFDLSAMWVKDKRDIIGSLHMDPVITQHEHQGEVEDYMVYWILQGLESHSGNRPSLR